MVRLESQGGDLTLEVGFCLIYRQTSSHVSIIQKNRTTLVPGSFQQFFDPSQEPLILTNLLTPSLRDGVLKSFLKKAQRAFSRKQKGSKNREKARKRLARLHRKVKRRRSDFLHKTSRRLVNDNQALIFETLKIQGMMKNHHLAKAIADAGWAEFMRQCEYKAKHEGRIFAKIGTFFPSSKTCSTCGHKLKELSLATRSWTCPHCGAHHDRDINASLNIKQEGIRMLKAAGLTVLRS